MGCNNGTTLTDSVERLQGKINYLNRPPVTFPSEVPLLSKTRKV